MLHLLRATMSSSKARTTGVMSKGTDNQFRVGSTSLDKCIRSSTVVVFALVIMASGIGPTDAGSLADRRYSADEWR